MGAQIPSNTAPTLTRSLKGAVAACRLSPLLLYLLQASLVPPTPSQCSSAVREQGKAGDKERAF